MKARVRKRAARERTFPSRPLKACVLALALSAAQASACAVCLQVMPTRTLHAYVGLTLGLSLLPIALSVLVFLALRRQAAPSAGDEDGGGAG